MSEDRYNLITSNSEVIEELIGKLYKGDDLTLLDKDILCEILSSLISFKKRPGPRSTYLRDRNISREYKELLDQGIDVKTAKDKLISKYKVHKGKSNYQTLNKAIKRGDVSLVSLEQFKKTRKLRKIQNESS